MGPGIVPASNAQWVTSMDRDSFRNSLLDYTTADILNTPIQRGGVLPLTRYPGRTEFDLSSGITGAVADAFTAPSRAYSGEMSEADMIPEGFNFAGNVTLGSLLAPRPRGSIGMGGRAANEAPQGIRAFHGSPHDFDRFDVSKIGTGEGAQAYGHGLYFAENEGVAKAYRDSLSKPPEPDAKAMQGIRGQLADLDAQIAEYAPYAANSPAMQRQVDMLNDSRAALMRQAAEDTQTRSPSGHMYEVRINADPADFLDYDAGISGQPRKVRQALSEIADDAGIPRGGFGDEIRSGNLDTLRTYVEQSLPHGELEKRLKGLGIPGIRYLDQGSRGAGQGSRNYVVFDDALVEIMRKYGLLGPVAAGTIAGALSDDGPIY